MIPDHDADAEAIADRDPRRARWVLALRVAFVVVVVAAFAKVAGDNAGQLRHVSLRVAGGWLALAVPATLVAAPLLPLAWRRVVIASGHPLDAWRGIRVWYLGQTGRYVPTGLAAFASRAVLAGREGIPRSVTVATMAVELGAIVGVGAGLAGAALPSSELATGVRVLLVGGALVGLAVAPFALRALSGRIRLLDPHRAGGWRIGALYRAEAGFVANAVAKTAAYVLLGFALLPAHGRDVWLLAGAFNAANTLGTIGITPAGLGVREGAAAAILHHHFGLGDAAAFAVAARAWDVAFELVWLAVVQLGPFRRTVAGPDPRSEGRSGPDPRSEGPVTEGG